MFISTRCFVVSVALVVLGCCYVAYVANNAFHDWLIYQPVKQRVRTAFDEWKQPPGEVI